MRSEWVKPRVRGAQHITQISVSGEIRNFAKSLPGRPAGPGPGPPEMRGKVDTMEDVGRSHQIQLSVISCLLPVYFNEWHRCYLHSLFPVVGCLMDCGVTDAVWHTVSSLPELMMETPLICHPPPLSAHTPRTPRHHTLNNSQPWHWPRSPAGTLLCVLWPKQPIRGQHPRCLTNQRPEHQYSAHRRNIGGRLGCRVPGSWPNCLNSFPEWWALCWYYQLLLTLPLVDDSHAMCGK